MQLNDILKKKFAERGEPEREIRILVTNDDGIESRGIHELVEALSGVAKVYVSAPSEQHSAAGHGLTINGSLMVREVDFPNAEKAYRITGTPADCVKLGVFLLRKDGIEPDMVFSGINHGGNLGTDTLYSGTVSGAMEGNIKGFPAVAISVKGREPKHFEYAKQIAADFAVKGFGEIGKNTTISVNVPDLPASGIKGIRPALLGPKGYKEHYEFLGEAEGWREFRYESDEIVKTDLSPMFDVVLIEQGYVTVTPLNDDLTDYSLLEETDGPMKKLLNY